MAPQRRSVKPATNKTRAPRAKKNRPPAKKQPARKPERLGSADAKPTVAVVGAGRVGTALALALERCGYPVIAVVSRTPAHARRAARLLASRPVALGARELERLPQSDILIAAVPDDQIGHVSMDLYVAMIKAAGQKLEARIQKFIAEGVVSLDAMARGVPRRRVAVHVSGAADANVLHALRVHGYSTGSLHPLVAVADAATGAENFRGAFFCVEGEARAVRVARSLVRDLGGQSFSVAGKDKVLYHAAAVFAAGHAVALFDVATQLLARCGVEPGLARRALLSLSETALKNLARARDNASALTGPFARRDRETVKAHIAALEDRGLRDELRLYLELGRRALLMAGGGATEGDGRLLREILRAQGRIGERGGSD